MLSVVHLSPRLRVGEGVGASAEVGAPLDERHGDAGAGEAQRGGHPRDPSAQDDGGRHRPSARRSLAFVQSLPVSASFSAVERLALRENTSHPRDSMRSSRRE